MQEQRMTIPVVLACAMSVFFVCPPVSLAGPLHDAVREGRHDVVHSILVEEPASVNECIEDQVTALHIAAADNNTNVIALLLEAGADVNACTAEGATPLHWAAIKNSSASLKMLMAAGADAEMRSKAGLTPIESARLAGHVQAEHVLSAVLPDKREAAESAVSAQTGLPAGDVAVRLEQARRSREAGDSQTAYDILVGLLKEDPASVEVNFELGLAALDSGRHGEAALAFERVLSLDPGNDRAKLELARSHFAQEQYEAARAQLESVLSHNPPPAVRMNIVDFLRLIDQAELGQNKKKVWSLQLDTALFYDDNVNIGPASDVVDIAPILSGSTTIDTLTVNEESQPSDAFGTYLSALLTGGYNVGRPQKWALAGSGQVYKSLLEDVQDREILYLSAIGGPQYLDRRYVVSTPVKVEHITLGSDSFSDIYGFEPVVTMLIGGKKATKCSVQVGAEYRDYTDIDDRDGPAYAIGFNVSRALNMAGLPGLVSLGCEGFREDADAKPYRNTGLAMTTGTELQFAKAMAGYVQLKFRTADYEDKEPLATEVRSDDQYQAITGLRIYSGLWNFGSSYQFTDNKSSFDLYEYRRNIVTLTAGRTF